MKGAYFLLAFLAIGMILSVPPISAYDFTLEIFGNANMDDAINEEDVAYIQGILNNEDKVTEFADANYDGKIDSNDIDQIEAIIHNEEKELTLLDSAGRVATIKMPIKRIVAINRNGAETLRTLKASDRIIGISDSALNDKSYFPEFREDQSIGSAKTPDIEKILNLDPDLVIYYGTQWTTDYEIIRDTLNKTDPTISIIGLDCYKPDTYIEDVIKLGYIVGRVTEAYEFASWYEDKINTINNVVKQIPDDAKPRVYEGGRSDFYQTGGLGSQSHNVIVMAGGKNIFDDLSGEAITIDPESVVERNPEFIIWKISNIGGYTLDKNETVKFQEKQNEILSRPELSNVSAVKNKNVYILSSDVFFGGRYFLSIIYMAKWFHPDLFRDIDPKDIHQEYLTRFQHLDYDLDQQGVFVYPEPT
ncbi:ABC transporter substrate-binding protein [Methanothrix sp.]|uniref:ABC transporter substrate-binding protein n=2 Tax=Methanothrix sp. TaxID=90426 RepID=UPI00257EE893|nr:ABC transporter substrate-binding protein [Methanothrix sp.]NPU87389.1 ABC transporter substrate-binding protein [Methanothrix sp.]